MRTMSHAIKRHISLFIGLFVELSVSYIGSKMWAKQKKKKHAVVFITFVFSH